MQPPFLDIIKMKILLTENAFVMKYIVTYNKKKKRGKQRITMRRVFNQINRNVSWKHTAFEAISDDSMEMLERFGNHMVTALMPCIGVLKMAMEFGMRKHPLKLARRMEKMQCPIETKVKSQLNSTQRLLPVTSRTGIHTTGSQAQPTTDLSRQIYRHTK